MLMQQILAYLDNQTAFFNPQAVSPIFTASHLAEKFAIKRNTASHYLNQLHQQGLLLKINSRPVYFLSKQAFEAQYYPVNQTTFNHVSELATASDQTPADHFSLLIGHQQSLKKAIEQIKTAIMYPDGGLPLLITGASGTGKSYLANLIHRYAISQAILAPNAPFINFNCAQYANNPELLASNLFGHIKGAFTGANHDQAGAFELANNGILFLDEVHRLNAEGQEKLFTYLDKGVIYRLGDSATAHPLAVRLIFATTEAIHSVFLTTFLRRIPIHIELPDLESRQHQEKEALIMQFLLHEARTINRELSITPQALALLKNYTYRGNVGELANTIKYLVASAFSQQTEHATIQITLHQLPDKLIRQPILATEQASQVLQISPQQNLNYLLQQHNPTQNLLQQHLQRLLLLFQQQRHLDAESMDKQMLALIEKLLDQLIFIHPPQHYQQQLLFMINRIRDNFSHLETRYNVQLNGNAIYAMSHYLYHRNQLPASSNSLSEQLTEQLLDYLAQRLPDYLQLAQQLLESLTQTLDIKPQAIDKVLLSYYLSKNGIMQPSQYSKAIIIAHGYATASSIANVANRLLEKNLFEAFDMPLDVKPAEIAAQVMRYMNCCDISKGLIILVDMGSLKAINQLINNSLAAPLLIINNVSTQMAYSVGEQILAQQPPETIIDNLQRHLQTDYQLIYPQTADKRVILTTCSTGIATAHQIKQLLQASIPQELAIEIIAYDYATLASNKHQEAIFYQYDVLAIIGTANPQLVDTTFISLEELISGQGNSYLSQLFNPITDQATITQINNAIIKNFSLESVIQSVSILDSNKVINHVEHCIEQYEQMIQSRISNDKKVALYVHVSCLIERLLRNAPIETHYRSRILQCQPECLNQIKQAFSVIETSYSVKIPQIELLYIHDILTQELQYSPQEPAF